MGIIAHLASTVSILERIFFVLLLVRMAASFFPPRRAGWWAVLVEWSERLTEPILAPIRRRVPAVGAFDFSPLIGLIAVDVAGYVLIQLLGLLARL